MIVTRVYPGHPEAIDLDEPGSRNTLLGWYAPPGLSVIRVNLITTLDGSVGGTDGTSHTLSNPADRKILGVIRELSDVVLVGAASVRAEGYVLPRHVPLAIVTSSGDLAGHEIDPAVAPGRLFVVCPEASVDRVRSSLGDIAVEIIGLASLHGRLSMTDVVTALRVRGLESIVCEGGPALAAQLIAADLVDELCLATSPVIGGSDKQLLPAGVAIDKRLTLEQLVLDDGSGIYARWSFGDSAITRAPRATGL